MSEIRICIQSLSHYNNGSLHFEWLNVSDYSSLEELNEKIQELLKKWDKAEPLGEPSEEYMMMDSEGLPDWLQSEYPDYQDIFDYVELCEEYGQDVIDGFYHCFGQCDDIREAIESSYQGAYKSEEDYCWEFLESTGVFDGISEPLRFYFDIEKYAYDVFINECSSYEGTDGKTHVFWNHW